MVTLLPIEPLNDAHGMLIVEAFSRLFINRGGQSDGWGDGDGSSGDGYGYGNGGGDGDGDGNGDDCDKIPEEWRVGP
jgi:hypothetical protein